MQIKKGEKRSKGRPLGSRNVKTILPKKLTEEAIKQLQIKVDEGDLQAVLFTLNRVYPALKPTAVGTEMELLKAQIELTTLKAQELSEFEARITELEALR